MKRILIMTLACTLLITMTACKQENTSSKTNQVEFDVQEQQTSSAEQAKTPLHALIRRAEKNQPGSTIDADMTYNTETMQGIAEVSDLVVTGSFESKESYVEDGLIHTKGQFRVEQILHGDCPDVITACMMGGTIPYSEIGQLYSPEELEKYGIDPNNSAYEEISTTFADMPIFETGQRYMLTLADEENGGYSIMPSIYNLCTLPDATEEPASLKSAEEIEQIAQAGEEEAESLDGTAFSIEEYLSYFN